VSDLRVKIAEAAFKALANSGEDKEIIQRFVDLSPGKVQLPSDLEPDEQKQIRKLLGLVNDGVTTVFGEETKGFVSTAALGKSSNEKSFGCSGFLVSPDIILTAGHCIAEGFTGGVWVQDVTGRHFLPPIPNASKRHEKFGVPTPFANDIGMIRLKEPVSGVDIYPIADGATIIQGNVFRIVGFGNDKNSSFSIDIKRTAEVHPRNFQALEFTIGDPLVANDGDACERDSGGPVIIEVAGKNYRLAGLISRGVNPDKTVCGDGTICLRLDSYTDWIDKNIKTLGGQPRPT
jgi:V8-like Glu-specific endopeptidase